MSCCRSVGRQQATRTRSPKTSALKRNFRNEVPNSLSRRGQAIPSYDDVNSDFPSVGGHSTRGLSDYNQPHKIKIIQAICVGGCGTAGWITRPRSSYVVMEIRSPVVLVQIEFV